MYLFLYFSRGPVRFKFQVLYELDSLAVVNVRDVDTVKNAFKILKFPESRIYQTDSTKSKVSSLSVFLVIPKISQIT